MKSVLFAMSMILLGVMLSGCKHPMTKTRNLELGMTPDEVIDELGDPDYVRSAKVFDNEETTRIFEYLPPFFTTNEKKLHIIFENERLVQWGAPGDYGTGGESSVKEYREKKQ